jgi:hypothetical protein
LRPMIDRRRHQTEQDHWEARQVIDHLGNKERSSR